MPDNNDSTKHVKLEYKANEPNGMYFIENNQPYGMVLNNSGAPVSDDQFATKGYVDNKIDSITPPGIDFYTIDSLPNNDTPKDWGIIKDSTTGASIGTMMGVKYLTEDQAENYGFTPSEDAPTEGHPTAENGYMLNIVDKNDSGYNKVIQKYITISGKEYIRHSNSDSAFSPWVDASGGGSGGGTGVITGDVSRDISQAVSSQGVWKYLNEYNSNNAGSGINLMALKLLTNDTEIFTNNSGYNNVRYWLDNNKRGYKLYSGDVTKMIPGYDTLYPSDPNISLLLNMPIITADYGIEATREGSVSQLLFVNNKIFYRYGNDAYSWLSGNGDTKGWSMLRTLDYDGPIDIIDGGTGAISGYEAFSNIIKDTNQYLTTESGMETNNVLECIAGTYLFNPHDGLFPSIINLPPIASDYDGNISLIITGEGDNKVYRCFILTGEHKGEYYIGKYDPEYDEDDEKYIIWNKMISYNNTTESSVNINNPTNISGDTSITGDLTVTGNISGNATGADKLSTARKIDGIGFDGSADISHFVTPRFIGYGTNYIEYELVGLPENYTLSNGNILFVDFKNITFNSGGRNIRGIHFVVNGLSYPVAFHTDLNSAQESYLNIDYMRNSIVCFIYSETHLVLNSSTFYYVGNALDPQYYYMCHQISVNDTINLRHLDRGIYTYIYSSDHMFSTSYPDDDPFKHDGKSRLLKIVVSDIGTSEIFNNRHMTGKSFNIYVIDGEDKGAMFFGAYNSYSNENAYFVWYKLLSYDDSEVQKFMNIENMKYLGWNVTDDPTVAAKYGLVGGSATVESSTDYWEHQPIENDTPDFWKTLGSGIAVFGGDGCVTSYYNNASGSTADEIYAYNNHKSPNKYMSDKSILKIHDQPHRFGIILSFPASGTGSSIMQIFYSRDFGVTEHSNYDLTKEYSYCYIRRGATHTMDFINENGYKINNNDGKNVWSDNGWVLLPISANNKFVHFGSHALSDVYDAYSGNSDKTNNEIQNMRYVFNTDKARKYRVGGISMVANQESVFILSNSTHGGGSTDTETIPAKDSDPNSDATKLWNILTNRYLYNTNIDSNNGNLTTTQRGRRNITLLSHKYATAANTNSKVEIVNHGGIDITIGHTDSTLKLIGVTNPDFVSGTSFNANSKGVRNIYAGTSALTVGQTYTGFSAGDIYIQYEP